jgi:D-2-hydroxyacid dehydrogenase (NADP+)
MLSRASNQASWSPVMSRPKSILLTVDLPAPLLAQIQAAAPGARLVTRSEAKAEPALWHSAEVLFTQRFRLERLREAHDLRWIQTLGAGVEWLVGEPLPASLIVTNASGVHPEPIAEHIFGLILALTRRLPEVLALQHERRWDSEPFLTGVPTLAGSTLGILGVGAIGQHVAQLGAAFGMRVIGLRRGAVAAPHVEHMYGPNELTALLAESHYVVNALPLTAATRGLLGPAQFAAMRSDAIFVNIGRGGTVQTDALVSALRDKRIRGAGLDVTDPEPLPSEHPLWSLPNIIITPHFSGGRPDYVERAVAIFSDNLGRYAAGETLHNLVDPQAGY